ncbi:EscU/YscU/HrcU family type III secretion system export apparatus switch protein [Defluviitalea phaphyphila]|uniref:EscU/YscU/HrcU family type III secretion system export apparatus switch protein n=1 Tax=Defluviitalea phaphyphila TaxID=1473580 RepID=UPI000730E7C6|nr:EscU/YscU/HrcU family type III secretion system export apparatus switch protein [Defluviitalea phaphyphila]
MDKKIRKAVAIRYEKGNTAPEVLAKGKGVIAENIMNKAKEENIPIYEDHKLADMLTELEIGDLIPPELYEVVAEILVFVGNIDNLQEKFKND